MWQPANRSSGKYPGSEPTKERTWTIRMPGIKAASEIQHTVLPDVLALTTANGSVQFALADAVDPARKCGSATDLRPWRA